MEISLGIFMVSFMLLVMILWGLTVAYYEDQLEKLKMEKSNQRSRLDELEERRKLYPVKIYRKQDEEVY